MGNGEWGNCNGGKGKGESVLGTDWSRITFPFPFPLLYLPYSLFPFPYSLTPNPILSRTSDIVFRAILLHLSVPEARASSTSFGFA